MNLASARYDKLSGSQTCGQVGVSDVSACFNRFPLVTANLSTTWKCANYEKLMRRKAEESWPRAGTRRLGALLVCGSYNNLGGFDSCLSGTHALWQVYP